MIINNIDSRKELHAWCKEHWMHVLESVLVVVAAAITFWELVSSLNSAALIRSMGSGNLLRVFATAVYQLILVSASVFFCICLWQNIKPQEKAETQAPQKNRKNRISWPSAICGTVILCNLAIPGILSYTPNALAALLWMAVFVLRLAAWLESKWLYHRWAAFFFAASVFFPYAALLSLFGFDENTLLNLSLSDILETISTSANKIIDIKAATAWGSLGVYASYLIFRAIWGYLRPWWQKNKQDSDEKKPSLLHRRRTTLYKECFQRNLNVVLPILYLIGTGVLFFCIPQKKELEHTQEWLQVLAVVGGLPLIVGDFILSRLKDAPLLKAERKFLQANAQECQIRITPDNPQEPHAVCKTIHGENDFIRKYCAIISHVICAIGTSPGTDRVHNYRDVLAPLQTCPDCEIRYVLEVLEGQRDLFARYSDDFRDFDVEEINRDISSAICHLFKVPDASGVAHYSGIKAQRAGQFITHLLIVCICFDPILESWIKNTTLQNTNELRNALLMDYIYQLIDQYKISEGREIGQCLFVMLCAKNCTAACIRKELFRQLLYYPRFAWNTLTKRYPSQFNGKRSDSVVQNDWVETYYSYFLELKRLGVTIDPDFWDGIDGEYFSSVIREKTPLNSGKALKSIINRLDPGKGVTLARVTKYMRNKISDLIRTGQQQEIVIAQKLLDILSN